MKKGNKSSVAFWGMLLGTAFVLAYVEMLIPFSVGIYGVKLGLANLVVLIALYTLGEKQAFMISVARVVLVSFTFGSLSALLYSLAGSILSYCAMCLGKKSKSLSITGVSVLGGTFHNIGQILVAVCIVENIKLFYYLPVLLISGTVTGVAIGIVSGIVLKRVKPVWQIGY